jgi:hypothetical protein
MRLTPKGLQLVELAVAQLLKNHTVRKVWSERDLWTWVMRLLAAILEKQFARDEIDGQLARITNPAKTIVLAPVANVEWELPPKQIGPLVLAGMKSDGSVLAKLLSEPTAEVAISQQLARLRESLDSGVVVAIRTELQGQLAHEALESGLDDLIGAVLLLAPSKAPPSLRGPVNRPGMRGTTLDRVALERLARAANSQELSHEEFLWGEFGIQTHIYWNSAEPLSLSSALTPDVGETVTAILRADDEICRRVRVAARWYATAHWAASQEDGILALGVALDALVGAKSGLPGSAMRQRFALLEADPLKRKDRARRHEALYSVRSAVAHGGSSAKIDSVGGARGFMEEVRWAAMQLMELRRRSIRIANRLDDFFTQLALGAEKWPDAH